MICRYKNIVINGSENKPIALDIFFNDAFKAPVVIYAHGFNGFKDWGNFDLVANQFVEQGFAFVKFNFSHNGTAPNNPEEFVDLPAFGNNNYSRQLQDLERVIEWTIDPGNHYAENVIQEKIFLIGHSMGGGIILVKAAENEKITALSTWAATAALQTPWGSWPAEKIMEWERTGVAYYKNSRTNQDMPLYFQLYLDHKENKERLDVLKAASGIRIPLLVCHGNNDDAVPVDAARKIAEQAKGSELFIVESDHVFGRKHPWTGNTLPVPMQRVVDKTIEFFSGKI